jgi:hypothetical protein
MVDGPSLVVYWSGVRAFQERAIFFREVGRV